MKDCQLMFVSGVPLSARIMPCLDEYPWIQTPLGWNNTPHPLYILTLPTPKCICPFHLRSFLAFLVYKLSEVLVVDTAMPWNIGARYWKGSTGTPGPTVFTTIKAWFDVGFGTSRAPDDYDHLSLNITESLYPIGGGNNRAQGGDNQRIISRCEDSSTFGETTPKYSLVSAQREGYICRI